MPVNTEISSTEPFAAAAINPVVARRQAFESTLILGVVDQGKPVVALADQNHQNPAPYEMLNNPQLMEGLAQRGVSDIYLEMNDTFQPVIDQFYAGEMTETEFRDRVASAPETKGSHLSTLQLVTFRETLADTIILAKKEGVKVHFYDSNQYSIESELALNNPEMMGLMRGGLIEQRTNPDLPRMNAKMKELGIKPEEFEAFFEEFLKLREKADPYFADKVANTMTGRGAIMVAGAGHFDDSKSDLDELLRDRTGQQVAMISVMANRKAADTFGGRFDITQDGPDIYYYHGEMQAVLTATGVVQNGLGLPDGLNEIATAPLEEVGSTPSPLAPSGNITFGTKR